VEACVDAFGAIFRLDRRFVVFIGARHAVSSAQLVVVGNDLRAAVPLHKRLRCVAIVSIHTFVICVSFATLILLGGQDIEARLLESAGGHRHCLGRPTKRMRAGHSFEVAAATLHTRGVLLLNLRWRLEERPAAVTFEHLSGLLGQILIRHSLGCPRYAIVDD